MADPMIAEGMVIDRFVIERLVGRGGTADVWAARHRDLGVRRAVKVLRSSDGAARERFLAEGRAQAGLPRHDHIVPVLDTLSANGTPALVLPLIEGPSLARLLKAHRLSEPDALDLIRGIVDGVAAAHEAGLVHCDLKPANVLLEVRRGRVQPLVADFGLARAVEGAASQRGRGGTLAYAAPEQLRGEQVDARADLWSLGVLVYEVLTGTHPFSDNPGQRTDDPTVYERPSHRGVSRRWDELVAELLRLDPMHRTPNARQLATQLSTFANGSDAGPQSPGLAAATWNLRNEILGSTPRRVEGPSATPQPTPGLPRERDAFVGRVADRTAISAELDGARVVTLTGMGGIGKTRLALTVARELGPHFSGGACFCDLSEARDALTVQGEVARALGLRLSGDGGNTIADALAGRAPLLLVLDNCEQVRDPVAQSVERWMEHAPGVKFLLTSREALLVPGEVVHTLDVLTLPSDDSVAACLESDAANLFRIRARQACLDFDIDDHNHRDVARLVRLLDGIPLAIELAAARVRGRPIESLVSRIEKSFEFLAGHERDAPERQKTMRATLDWSWNLLTPHEQIALTQLSVFEGGFSLENAERVLELPAATARAEDVVGALVRRSLVQQARATGSRTPRFWLLLTVQAYAASRLAPDHAAGARRRHLDCFAEFGTDDAIDSLCRHGGVEARAALDVENLQTAFRHAVALGDASLAARTARALWQVFELRGPPSVGAEYLERVLEMPGLEPAMALRVRTDAGRARQYSQEEGVALSHLDQAILLARDIRDVRYEAIATMFRAIVDRQHGRFDDALVDLRSARATFHAIGDVPNEGVALAELAAVHERHVEYEQARASCEASLERLRAVGHLRHEAIVLSKLGDIDLYTGRLDEAKTNYEAALAWFEVLADRGQQGDALQGLALVCQRKGQWADAQRFSEAAIAVAREAGDILRQLDGLQSLGVTHAERREWDKARECFDATLSLSRGRHARVEAMVLGNMGAMEMEMGHYSDARLAIDASIAAFRAIGDARLEGVFLMWAAELETRAARFQDARARFTEAEAILRAGDLKIDLATMFCLRAELELAQSDVRSAMRSVAEAELIAAATNSGATSELGRRIAQVHTRLKDGVPQPGSS